MPRREIIGPIFAVATMSGAAAADDTTRAAVAEMYPELHRSYYDMAVCEYCGFVSAEIVNGHQREVADLVARDSLDDARHRAVRIHAWTAADLEYGNRGLGGFRNWCRTEGVAAARRFLNYPAPTATGGGNEE